MQNKNFLKLSLYECKFDKNQLSDYGNFKLSISFNSKSFTTDKININHTKFKGGKFFYFEIPQTIDENQNLSISAIGTSWMFFNSIICSGQINYKKNLSNFNDKKFWYSLKNKENKEIMQILISIWTEYSILDNTTDLEGIQQSKLFDISLINDKSSFINHSSIFNLTFTEKNDKTKLNNTTIVKTQRDSNNPNKPTKGLVMNSNKETNPSFIQDNLNINKTSNNIILNTLNNTNKINKLNNKAKNNLINRNINNIDNNNYAFSSPFIVKDNLSGLLIGNNISYINSKNENDLDNNKIDYDKIIALIEKYEQEGGDKNSTKKLYEQINILKEKEKNLEKQQIKYNEALNKLKDKDKMLNKEKLKLENKISKFKKEQSDYEQKNINLTEYILNFENNLNKFNEQENIYNNNKEIFYNLNYYISTGNNLPLNDDEFVLEYKNKNKTLLTSNNELIDSLNIDKINKI